MIRVFRWLRFSLALISVLGLTSTGCSGLSPGDYVVYRLSVGALSYTAGCFEDGEIPVDLKSDVSDVGVPATVVLQAGPDETFYLDMGSATYAGTATGKGFRFIGESVDVTLETGGPMMMDAKKEEVRTTTTIEFEVDGASVQGAVAEQIEYRCTGDACPEIRERTCKRNRSFVGNEVEDVELEHTI
jgi:hypothetical protein